MALKYANEDAEWVSWSIKDFDEDIEFGWRFIQFELFTQWAKIKDYANQKGIGIIGDIPIYVSFDSSDV